MENKKNYYNNVTYKNKFFHTIFKILLKIIKTLT